MEDKKESKELDGIDRELIEKAINYLIEQEEKKEKMKERKLKRNIAAKIRERMPRLSDDKLIELDTKDLGTLSRILRELDYKEPYFPIGAYTAAYERMKMYKWYILGLIGLIAVILILRALIA